MTHPEQPPVLAEDTDPIDPFVRSGAMKRCFASLRKYNRGGPGAEEVLALATMKVISKIDQCHTRVELIDFVIRFVGGLDIFSIDEDALSDDPDLFALDAAIRSHGVDPMLARRPGQAARTLKHILIDRINGKGLATDGMGHIDGGISIGGNDKDDDALLSNPKVTGSAFQSSAERAYFTDVYDAAQDRVSVELIRGVYLPVLLDRGRSRDAGSSKARTWIRYFHLTAMWLFASGQSSNQYAKDHQGVHASDLTKARQRLSETLRICIYADDLLCPARPAYDPDDQPWSPAATEDAEDPTTFLSAILSPPEETDAPLHSSGPGNRAPTVTQALVWTLNHPRCAHLDACLDVIDRIDAGKILTTDEARILRLAAGAVTATDNAGTRVDANRYALMALDLDPEIRTSLTQFRNDLAALKPRAFTYVERRLCGEALDTHQFDDVITTLFHGDSHADVLEGVSPRPRQRAARLIAVRTGERDPTPGGPSIDPHDEAIRLIEVLHRPVDENGPDGASRRDRALHRISDLISRYGRASERHHPNGFLAMATNPGTTDATFARLRQMITASQAVELNSIIVTAVNHRIDDALRDRFRTGDKKTAAIEQLHGVETLYAYWAHTTFSPDQPLAFNCVRPNDDHNPTPDRTSEIPL